MPAPPPEFFQITNFRNFTGKNSRLYERLVNKNIFYNPNSNVGIRVPLKEVPAPRYFFCRYLAGQTGVTKWPTSDAFSKEKMLLKVPENTL